MASLNQLVSEFAHAVGNPNSIPLRRNLRYAILHGRNELIRKSYENHKYVDKGLQQRIRVSIINVPDGDLYNSQTLGLPASKRTKQEVPKPVRLINNLPFQSIRTTGHTGIEIPFAKEASAKFYHYLAGMCNLPVYDYINGYIYFFSNNKDWFQNIGSIIIESPTDIFPVLFILVNAPAIFSPYIPIPVDVEVLAPTLISPSFCILAPFNA